MKKTRRISLFFGLALALSAGQQASGADAATLHVIGIGDSLTHGTMDATNNARNTLNAYLQRVVLALRQATPVASKQALFNQQEERIRPFVTPTNLGVDGTDSFSMEGVEYYKRVGAAASFVTDAYLCNRISPQMLDDVYDKVLYPIDLWAGQPVSQMDALEWWLEQIAAEPDNNSTVILFWVGNNDASTASLGAGGANPAAMPLPFDLVSAALTDKARRALQLAQSAGEISFEGYSTAMVNRNLTDAADFTAQFDGLMTRLTAKLATMPDTKPVQTLVMTLPYYSAAAYLMDADDLEQHLRQLDPDYTVPPSFARPVAGSTVANNGDRVSVLTFGFMYTLLATGYSSDYVNQTLEQNGEQRDGMVLSEAEQAIIVARIDSFNDSIRAATQAAADAGVDVQLLDVGARLNDVLLGRTPLVVDGRPVSRHWASGDAFSLDGVHPGYVGHSLIANQVLDALNARLSLSAPLYDLDTVSQKDPYADRDGDGWVAATDAPAFGLPRVLRLLRDADDNDASVHPALPDDVWEEISDSIIEQLRDSL